VPACGHVIQTQCWRDVASETLAALYHAKQTCLAAIAVPALVAGAARRAPITISLVLVLNTEGAQRSAGDALLRATTAARNFAMMGLAADSVYRLAR
jgi:hypothetical protein